MSKKYLKLVKKASFETGIEIVEITVLLESITNTIDCSKYSAKKLYELLLAKIKASKRKSKNFKKYEKSNIDTGTDLIFL